MSETAPDAPAPGYLAVPTQPKPDGFPGVVVVHDVFGMTPDLKRQADRLATGGYLALAPDLWQGKPWIRCIRGAFRQVMAGSGPAFEQIDAAAAWLSGRADCTGKIGIIGFCMGGGFALLSAPRPAFSAASVNYAPVPKNIDSMLDGACPIVASYGGKDPGTTKQLPLLEKVLEIHAIPHDVKVYPGATHAFMNEFEGGKRVLTKVMNMRYDPDATADSWRRIFAFFGEYLDGEGPAS
jgi:carboxymethylenebutenolidase